MEKYLPNKAVDLTGKNIEEIYKSVKAGQPVVTSQMQHLHH